MLSATLLTVEEFFAHREEFPEHGRWCEIIEGRLMPLAPPCGMHTGVVLNLAKALGEFVHQTHVGYACFDLGIVVARNPDTMRLACIAFYRDGPRFEFSDARHTTVPPALIADVASSPDRIESMPERVADYLTHGVGEVWTLDPAARSAAVHRAGEETQTLDGDAFLTSPAVLPGFRCAVGPLFVVPKW